MVIEGLAADVALLRDQVRGYREMVVVAMNLLFEQANALDSLQGQQAALRDELRRYTAAKVG